MTNRIENLNAFTGILAFRKYFQSSGGPARPQCSPMSYHPAIVANAFLRLASLRDTRLDQLKLHKLVFHAHVWSLVRHRKSVVDAQPEAWEHGPVFDAIYYRLKGAGAAPISLFLETFDPSSGKHRGILPAPDDTQTWDVVSQVMMRCGTCCNEEHCELGQEHDGPWASARQRQELHLQDEDIINFYGERIAFSGMAIV